MQRKKVIAVDFDNTLVKSEFPKILELNKELVAWLKEVKDKYIICIWTSRSGKYISEMIEYLDTNKVPYHYINDNPTNPYKPHSRKILADVYIDDRAVNLDFNSLEKAKEMLK